MLRVLALKAHDQQEIEDRLTVIEEKLKVDEGLIRVA